MECTTNPKNASQSKKSDIERILERTSDNHLQDLLSRDDIENIQHWEEDDLISPDFEETPDQLRVRPRQRDRDDDRFEQKELPKTINSVFGSIEDFLNFFVKRNPEIRDFAKQYKEIEETKDLKRLNTIICPELATCIRKESQKEASLSKEEANPATLFEREFDTFDQFYAEVLRAYTMSSFLYRNLNRYMRNEDWNAFNDLLPYAFSLCKTFFIQNLASDFQKHLQTKKFKSSSIFLYRGASFDKDDLRIYNPETLKNFSWHSVTSTTTNLRIGKRFMGGSDPESIKTPALFMIEVPLMDFTSQKYLSYLDMRPFSEYKMEDEVILPPGSVFTLQEVKKHPDGFMIIKLKLVSDVGVLSQEGLIMPGAMQSKMMTENEAKIMCVDGNDLFEALKHVEGNNLIKEIEFCLCKFDADTLKKTTDILPKMDAIKRLKFISCSYDGKDIELKNKLLKTNRIEIIELDQRFYKVLFPLSSQLISLDFAFANTRKVTSQTLEALCVDCLQNLPQLESLSLNLTRCVQLVDQDVANLCSFGLKNLTKLLSLNLNFMQCKDLTDQSLVFLSTDGLYPLLTSLTLNFAYCKLITDQGISSLSEHSLPRLTSFSLCIHLTSKVSDQSLYNLISQYPLLTHLDLDFSQCDNITPKSLESLPKTLTSLILNLANCHQLTDSSITSLLSSLLLPIHLISLDISLSRCSKLTNQAISQLSRTLQNLSSLTSLNLDLSGCELITDGAVKDLASYGLKSLAKLTSLSLNFESCNLRNEALDALSLNAFSNLHLLQALDINIYWCSFIDDQGLITLFTKGLPQLKSLTSLNLNFCLLYKLSDQGVHALCSQGLSQLTYLQSLSINLSRCEMITDQGLLYLLEGLKLMRKLIALSLDLTKCQEITQEGVNILEAQISQYLPQLISLAINFKVFSDTSDQYVLMIGSKESNADPEMSLSLLCERQNLVMTISPKSELQDELEESLFNIAFENQQPFTHPNDPKFSLLSSFHLSFKKCGEVTAQILLTLASQGLRYLTYLTSLNIDFSLLPAYKAPPKLPAITDQSFAKFCSEGLRSLQGLTSLTLNLRQCSNLTDQVMHIICSQTLEYYSKLSSLTLELGWCRKLTDQAIEILCLQGLGKLPSLKSLDLAFQGCKGITDQGLKALGVHIPTQLASLSLNFGDCPAISDTGFRYLVQNRTEFEVLALIFSTTKITNEALMIFASQELAKMSKLTELELRFENCHGIDDQGVSVLCREGLRKLKGLEKLVLDFEGCKSVTDVAVNDFCSLSLRNLKMLKEVKLYFESCPNISDFTRRHIKKILRYFGFKITNLNY